MKRHILKKEFTTVLFLLILFAFAGINFYHTLPFLKKVDVQGVNDLNDIKRVVNDTETVMSDKILAKYTFIEGYGLWNLILDKNEIDGFEHIKDNNGYLHYSDFWNNSSDDVNDIVNTVLELKKEAAKSGTDVIVVMPPVKDGNVTYEKGIPYCDKNWLADEYLGKLKENNVKVMDFRETLANSDLTYDETFYVTDHHWTTEAVFYCYQEFVKQMDEWYKLNLDSNGLLTDEDNYNKLVYKDSTLGSHGREAGIVYSRGLDDFTLMYPKYYTNFTYSWSMQNMESVLNGRFEDTVVSTYNIVNSNVYGQDKYSSYMNGIADFDKIKNNSNKDAPKVLFLRDSCTSPFAAFAALVFSETDLMWTLKLDNNLGKYYDIADYNYIIISLYPDSIKDSMFKFKMN